MKGIYGRNFFTEGIKDKKEPKNMVSALFSSAYRKLTGS